MVSIPFLGGGSDPYDDLGDSLASIRGDADALALLPYDDGTFWMKPAYFDKELIGGQGGYETDDGDKIVLDGEGKPVREFLGVKIVTGLDPTEHAGAVDLVKSSIAHKHNLGEWIKVDKKGNIIEVGDALMAADEDTIDVGVEGSMVDEEASQVLAQNPDLNEQMAYDRAMAELEKRGDITKIYDLAPPAAATIDSEGNVDLEQATHIAVDQAKGADLMPTTTSTTELNTALDKARMEEYEEGKHLKYAMYGLIAGVLISLISGSILIAINSFV